MRVRFIIVCLFLSMAVLGFRSALYIQSWPVIVSYDPPKLEISVSDMSEDSDSLDSELLFPLDLNFVTETQLMQIPRIGEVLASRIVQYRDVLGGYTELSQLAQIKGISDNMLEQLSPYLYIS